MKLNTLLIVAALTTFSGAALAGKQGVPGAGSGSGTVISPPGLTEATIGFGLINVPGNPALFTRISGLQGSTLLPDGSVESPPVRLPNGDVVRITVDRSGKIVKMVKV